MPSSDSHVYKCVATRASWLGPLGVVDYRASMFRTFLSRLGFLAVCFIFHRMFTVPSLRARDCDKNEKDALNYAFLVRTPFLFLGMVDMIP